MAILMKASDAKISTMSVIRTDVDKALESAAEKIQEAINLGRFSTTLVLNKFNSDVRDTLFQNLRASGYEVSQSVDQRSANYATVSWR